MRPEYYIPVEANHSNYSAEVRGVLHCFCCLEAQQHALQIGLPNGIVLSISNMPGCGCTFYYLLIRRLVGNNKRILVNSEAVR